MDENINYNPFQPIESPVTVLPISNGYLVQGYNADGRYEQWYAIDEQEVGEKLRKFLF